MEVRTAQEEGWVSGNNETKVGKLGIVVLARNILRLGRSEGVLQLIRSERGG